MTKKAVVHTDGASLGNPGHSGIGVVIALGGKVYEIAEYIGSTTNNVAEYSAILCALKEAKRLGAEELELYTDSELVVRQLNGRYKVKHPNLIPLHAEAMQLLKGFRKRTIEHVPREDNRLADRLSKLGADPKAPKPPAPKPQIEPPAPDTSDSPKTPKTPGTSQGSFDF